MTNTGTHYPTSIDLLRGPCISFHDLADLADLVERDLAAPRGDVGYGTSPDAVDEEEDEEADEDEEDDDDEDEDDDDDDDDDDDEDEDDDEEDEEDGDVQKA